MATIKSYTDLEQSRKLAKIIPLETADMMYHSVESEYGSGAFVATSKVITNGFENDDFYIDDIPCWSLTALLGVLPIVDLCTPTLKIKLSHRYYMELCIDCIHNKYLSTNVYNNPIDACVEMIIKLSELKML